MELHGKNLIGSTESCEGAKTFSAVDPSGGNKLVPFFHQATEPEVDRAVRLAEGAFEKAGRVSPEQVARLLEKTAEGIEELGDVLIRRAGQESGLSEGRLKNERGRTTAQLRMFAEVVREGSWVEARIDRAIPDRKPLPKPDLRRMLVPIGPVAVFGACNFPLAFSVAGGDTASAFAAGNPVVVKAHPAHPGTSELVGCVIQGVVAASDFPEGWFSMVHGVDPEVSLWLVRHPGVRAVGFTGSLKAGRAIFDAAAARPEPIPVYAEMGSVNPVFILPGAVRERGVQIAQGLAQSVTLGAGQFCTCPGVVVGLKGEGIDAFKASLSREVAAVAPQTMLHRGIAQSYETGLKRLEETEGICSLARSGREADPGKTQAASAFFETEAATFLRETHRHLREELFGPSSLLVWCASPEETLGVARCLEGSLTATIHGTEEDLERFSRLVSMLRRKAGRLVFNGFPTGVEVCPSMHHGGPYPATTDVRSTSVGTAAIQRFARPVCFQNAPASLLPPELRDEDPRKAWRLVDNEWTRGDA
jgi:NADP-dependent aldehyde dehydrogenase